MIHQTTFGTTTDHSLGGSEPAGRVPQKEVTSDPQAWQSWLFRTLGILQSILTWIGGGITLLLLLAVLANLPILNLLVLGYLFETSRRIGSGESFSKWLVGYRKAAYLGKVFFSFWVLVLPIRFISHMHYEAWLIDPESDQVIFLLRLQYGLAGAMIAHFVAALLCGGKLRYFFWPLVIPLSLSIWLVSGTVKIPLFRRFIASISRLFCPGLVADLDRFPPLNELLLPALFYSKLGHPGLFGEFVSKFLHGLQLLKLSYFFRVGLLGLIGSLAWLFIPTSLLIAATSIPQPGIALSAGVLGWMIAVPVFAALPILQTHFAVGGRLSNFFELSAAFSKFGRAPIWYLIAWMLAVTFSLPLFLLKIETIPAELLWILSLVFLVFTWPTRVLLGWFYRRATQQSRPAPLWISLPIGLLTLPISVAFVSVLTITRYTSWGGTFSLFENHLFLLPAPFWF